MEQASNYAAVAELLAGAKRVLLTTHENPDGDALASVCLLYDALTTAGKEVYIFCKSVPDAAFHFLTHLEHVQSALVGIPFADLDLVVVLDCASLKRTGAALEINTVVCPVVNIDHHRSNDRFGSLQLIDAEAVSTTQILYELYQVAQWEISKIMATCMLTGILTDSGNFAYAATNAQTFTIASDMLQRGANVRDILRYTNKAKRLPVLHIWGLALSRLRHNTVYDIVYTVLTKQDLQDFGVGTEDLDGLSNFLNTLKDATIVMVLYELPDGRIKGSFRATHDGVDVSGLAQSLGGGGHAKAAGFEIVGRLEQRAGDWRIV